MAVDIAGAATAALESPSLGPSGAAPGGASPSAPASPPPASAGGAGVSSLPAQQGSAPGGTPGAVGQAATAPGATPEPEWMSILDAAKNYGYQFDQGITDDHAAIQHLIAQAQRARQLEQLAAYGQQYVQHASAFQQWMQQQQQAQLAAQQQ